MIYVKIKNHYMTFKEIAIAYNLPVALIKGRYQRGVRDIKELIQPKHDSLRK